MSAKKDIAKLKEALDTCRALREYDAREILRLREHVMALEAELDRMRK